MLAKRTARLRAVTIAVAIASAAVATVASAADPIWYLRNSNSSGFAEKWIVYGQPSDFFIAGDWNRDRVDSPGVVRRNPNGTWNWMMRHTLTTGVADFQFVFGGA